jgi:4-amino-4-deoxy-L-arabinose transferase-like glycosyltransferase
MAASMKAFGVGTAPPRLPLALTVLALALALESFARRAFASTRAGLYAALITLSSFGIFIFTRITIPDAMVCLWLTLAVYCYWLTEQEQPMKCHPDRSAAEWRDLLLYLSILPAA